MASALRSSTAPTSAIRTLAVDAVQRLSRRLVVPPRAENDWSIDWTPSSDPDERRLAEFLRSPTDRTLSWPLAQSRREHVQRLVEVAGLPVVHRTVRQGRPYTPVLEKTSQLFSREATARRQATADHRWLIDTFGVRDR